MALTKAQRTAMTLIKNNPGMVLAYFGKSVYTRAGVPGAICISYTVERNLLAVGAVRRVDTGRTFEHTVYGIRYTEKIESLELTGIGREALRK